MKPLPPFTRSLPFHAWHDVNPCVPSAFTAVVEIPLGTVMSRLARARKLLQRQLCKEFKPEGQL